MALVNIDKLYLAIIDKDEVGYGNLIFQTPEYIPGIQQFGAKLKVDTGILYEEGKLTEQNSVITSIDVTIDLGHLSNTQYAKYLGHTVATEGGIYASVDDAAPYVALLYEYTKSNNKKGWKIYYKGQLTEPDESVKQQEGKINYQNHSVTATFQQLNNNGMWKYTVEEDDPNCPADIANTFFTSVIVPGSDTTAPTATTVPLDGVTGVVANSGVIFTFSKPMSLLSIDDSTIFLIKADGTPVTSTLSMDDTKKIVTLKPTTDLLTGSYVAICTKNVKSVSNIALATNVVVNFTV
jgi:phage major tail protein, phi13 family